MVEISKLDCPFSMLGMGAKFIREAESLGLHKLGDLLDVNLTHLKKHKNFNFLWYADMLDLLKSQGLLRQFQEKQLDLT
ncbi:hypothetical protein [Mucilaginibacter flavus]|uniref:hypothetical protein n=1 Tax=Mucilaginibacter flavus TaxID=931504 RepID=UPI0025B38398|nr:hypothetical protein [Mucilaginibacter flavus]